jgi:hypothetical protein
MIVSAWSQRPVRAIIWLEATMPPSRETMALTAMPSCSS